METIYFTPLPEVAQLVVGQVGSSCAEPSWWQLAIISGLVVASGVVLVSTGVGLAGIVTTLVGLIMTGASLATIATELGVHLAVISGSVEILGVLISAIQRVLGC